MSTSRAEERGGLFLWSSPMFTRWLQRAESANKNACVFVLCSVVLSPKDMHPVHQVGRPLQLSKSCFRAHVPEVCIVSMRAFWSPLSLVSRNLQSKLASRGRNRCEHNRVEEKGSRMFGRLILSFWLRVMSRSDFTLKLPIHVSVCRILFV